MTIKYDKAVFFEVRDELNRVPTKSSPKGDEHFLFRRSVDNTDGNNHEEIWDDSALIKEYDEIMAVVHEQIGKLYGTADNVIPTHERDKILNKKMWKRGDICMAPFAEDELYYRAEIIKLFEKDNTCEVSFTGYDTFAYMELDKLLDEDDVVAPENELDAAAEIGEKTSKSEDAAQNVIPTHERDKILNKKMWKHGDICMAPFAEDELYYRAEIVKVFEDENKIEILYTEYNTAAYVELDKLLDEDDVVAPENELDAAAEIGEKTSKSEDAAQNVIPTHERDKILNKKMWKRGDICMAPFAEDELYYRAEIIKLFEKDNTCEVSFTGYDTFAYMELDKLLDEDDVVAPENELDAAAEIGEKTSKSEDAARNG